MYCGTQSPPPFLLFALVQYWLGGSPENVESLLLNLAKSYVPTVMELDSVKDADIAEPVLLPDKGIWHPVADKVFENAKEYLAWYNEVRVIAWRCCVIFIFKISFGIICACFCAAWLFSTAVGWWRGGAVFE